MSDDINITEEINSYNIEAITITFNDNEGDIDGGTPSTIYT